MLMTRPVRYSVRVIMPSAISRSRNDMADGPSNAEERVTGVRTLPRAISADASPGHTELRGYAYIATLVDADRAGHAVIRRGEKRGAPATPPTILSRPQAEQPRAAEPPSRGPRTPRRCLGRQANDWRRRASAYDYDCRQGREQQATCVARARGEDGQFRFSQAVPRGGVRRLGPRTAMRMLPAGGAPPRGFSAGPQASILTAEQVLC